MADRAGIFRALAHAALILFALLAGPVTAAETVPDRAEQRLIGALDHLGGNRVDLAIRDLEQLIRDEPRFKLAQLVYGDLLMAKAGNAPTLTNAGSGELEQVRDLLQEARLRVDRYRKGPGDKTLPSFLLHIPPSVKHVIAVDLRAGRTYVYENNPDVPRLIRDYYTTIGKNGTGKESEGDKRTPVGVYYVTSRLYDDKLPDLYGTGALPINYPNAWDKLNGKTGHGIWLHGTPRDTYARAPRASDGCVVLSNVNFDDLTSLVEVGRTPVVLAEQLEWIDVAEWVRRRAEAMALVEQWRRDWESLDTDRYLSHYSRSFRGQGKDYRAWARHKRRVNSRKSYIRVELSDIQLFAYPGERDMLVVRYRQHYRSSNYEGESEKRQYWRREDDGRWRIVSEGPA
jgi:murein L,D-transpeptidase YafK